MPVKAEKIISPKTARFEQPDQNDMQTHLANLPTAVCAVRDKFRHFLSDALALFFEHVDESLFKMAENVLSNQEQHNYLDATREMRKQRANFSKEYIRLIETAFDFLDSANKSVSSISPIEELLTRSSDHQATSLSLVDDQEVEQMVAIKTLATRALAKNSEAVQHISLRLNCLVPAKVYQKNNPVGPEVLSTALMVLCKKLNMDITAKLIVIRAFDKTLMNSLPGIYENINQILIKQKILPSISNQVQKKKSPPGKPASARSRATTMNRYGSSVIPSASVEQRVFLSSLERIFGKSAAVQSPSSLTVDTESNLVKILSIAQKLPLNVANSSGKINSHKILERICNHKGMNAHIGKMDEKAINLVDRLFYHIQDDANLALPIKTLLSRLQIPVVKVAILDKSFFTSEAHPARKLLNEMAAAAVGWQNHSEPGDGTDFHDPFYQKMSDIVRRVLQDFAIDMTIFSDLLTEFSEFIKKEKLRSAVIERRIIDSEDGKARADIARTAVALEVELRLKVPGLPEVARTLIRKYWSKVMFIIALKHGFNSSEWQETLTTMDDLVRSVKISHNDESKRLLIKLVPDLVNRLQEGLESISTNPSHMANIFKSLERVHLNAIRGKAAPPPQGDKESSVRVFPPRPRGAMAAAGTRVDVRPLHTNPPATESAASKKLPEREIPKKASELLPEDDLYLRQVGQFSQGAWFELTDDRNEIIRCRLAAFIKPASKYIFVNRNGLKVAEKSPEELALGLKYAKVKVLNNDLLFDRALETVISGMRRH